LPQEQRGYSRIDSARETYDDHLGCPPIFTRATATQSRALISWFARTDARPT
jgi:hypothetical protein